MLSHSCYSSSNIYKFKSTVLFVHVLKGVYVNTLLGISIFIAAFTVFIVVSNLNEPKILFVSGLSMYPAYLPFDMLVVEDVKREEIKMGDVIVIDNSVNYLPYKNYVVHRVNFIMVTDNYKIGTQGDNNPKSDGLTLGKDVIGRISHHIPFIGYILAPPFSYGVILGTGLLFFFYSRHNVKI